MAAQAPVTLTDYAGLAGTLRGGMTYLAASADAALAAYGDNAAGLRARLAEIAEMARGYAQRGPAD
jgi:hypothetical protein